MPFGSLWLPVVVSAVAVFLVSSVLHMLLRYHRADYRRLTDEERVGEALSKAAPGPGLYALPYCDPKEMKQPAVQERYRRGPVGFVVLLPNGLPVLGKHLALWFGLCLLVSFTAAYVARHALSPGADGLTVMRITGTVAFAGYGLGYFQDSIWKGFPWANSFRGLLDALIYGVLTGLLFRLLWPGAA